MPQTHRQTDRQTERKKLDAPKFHSRGNVVKWLPYFIRVHADFNIIDDKIIRVRHRCQHFQSFKYPKIDMQVWFCRSNILPGTHTTDRYDRYSLDTGPHYKVLSRYQQLWFLQWFECTTRISSTSSAARTIQYTTEATMKLLKYCYRDDLE